MKVRTKQGDLQRIDPVNPSRFWSGRALNVHVLRNHESHSHSTVRYPELSSIKSLFSPPCLTDILALSFKGQKDRGLVPQALLDNYDEDTF